MEIRPKYGHQLTYFWRPFFSNMDCRDLTQISKALDIWFLPSSRVQVGYVNTKRWRWRRHFWPCGLCLGLYAIWLANMGQAQATLAKYSNIWIWKGNTFDQRKSQRNIETLASTHLLKLSRWVAIHAWIDEFLIMLKFQKVWIVLCFHILKGLSTYWIEGFWAAMLMSFLSCSNFKKNELRYVFKY